MMGSRYNINLIQFFLSDGVIEHISRKVGSQNFNLQYNVPPGDEIKCIKFGIRFYQTD